MIVPSINRLKKAAHVVTLLQYWIEDHEELSIVQVIGR
jgi:hypothetical protein